MSLEISLSFEDGALDDFKEELAGVAELHEREQITTDEAERWADEAYDDLIENKLQVKPI